MLDEKTIAEKMRAAMPAPGTDVHEQLKLDILYYTKLAASYRERGMRREAALFAEITSELREIEEQTEELTRHHDLLQWFHSVN